MSSFNARMGKGSSLRSRRRRIRERGEARVQAILRPAVEELELRTMLSLVINPTFAANITSDPNAATIEATINRTIAAYESFISDNVTVDITFQEGGGLGGSGGGLGYYNKYKDYRSAPDSPNTSATDKPA